MPGAKRYTHLEPLGVINMLCLPIAPITNFLIGIAPTMTDKIMMIILGYNVSRDQKFLALYFFQII